MLIAFSAKAHSGKTTSALMIQGNNTDFVIKSFATPLKRIAIEHFGLTLEDLNDKIRTINLGGRTTTVRQLLIDIGLMYRKLDPDFWVKMLWKDIESISALCPDILIDDLRFKNEAIFLAGKGATLIRIERPGVTLIDDESENDLDDWTFPYRLLNDGSLDNLKTMVLGAFEHIKAEAPLP